MATVSKLYLSVVNSLSEFDSFVATLHSRVESVLSKFFLYTPTSRFLSFQIHSPESNRCLHSQEETMFLPRDVVYVCRIGQKKKKKNNVHEYSKCGGSNWIDNKRLMLRKILKRSHPVFVFEYSTTYAIFFIRR